VSDSVCRESGYRATYARKPRFLGKKAGQVYSKAALHAIDRRRGLFLRYPDRDELWALVADDAAVDSAVSRHRPDQRLQLLGSIDRFTVEIGNDITALYAGIPRRTGVYLAHNDPPGHLKIAAVRCFKIGYSDANTVARGRLGRRTA
jgi:hypothetical protein